MIKSQFAALALLLALVTACGAEVEPTVTPAAKLDVPPMSLPSETPTPTAIPTLLPSETPPPPEPTPTMLPAETPTAAPAPTAASASWYEAGVVALFTVGDDSSRDLYALESDGSTRLILSSIGKGVRLSPDGRWLSTVLQDGSTTLELRDVQTGANRLITPDTTSGMFSFAFDRTGRRLAYLDLGEYDESGVPWTLVVIDLEKNTTSRYDALMTREDRQFLPGSPLGWSGVPTAGDELIIGTFVPYSDSGYVGVWGLTLPPDGASAPLDTLPLRELISNTLVGNLKLSPDYQNLAFLNRNRDYMPDDYFPEFFDLAVNRLEIVALNDGARTLLVEASDGSALGRTLAWSPAGDRLLFAQGRYEGQDLTTLTLKSSDLSGAVIEYSSLTLPPASVLSLDWCTETQVFYSIYSWGENAQHRLFSYNLTTGVSTELSSERYVYLEGCAP